MAPAKKRKIASSTSGGNTLLSYFASPNGSNSSSTRGGAAQSPSSHFKKVKLERREVSVSPLSPLSGKENRHLNAVAGGKEKGTREEPIEIPADDDDDEEAVEVLVKGERDGAPMDAETINCDGELNPDPPPPERASTADLVPPLDCTPPPAPILTAQAPGLTRAPSCVPQPGGAFFTLRDAPDMEMEMEMAFEPGEGDVWETGDDELAPGEEGTEFGGDDDRAVEEEEDGAEEGPEETGELGHPSGADVDGRGGEGGASAEGLGCPICGTVIADLAKLQLHVNACLDSPPAASASAAALAPSPTLPVPRDPRSKRSPSPLKPLSTPNFSLPTPAPAPPPNPSAFSVLMSQNKDTLAWAQAELDDARGGGVRGTAGRRKAPFYKVLQGMPVAVDAFRYGRIPGVTAYCLTHAHSDHYTNLSSSWKHGPIYCSETTANLIKLNLSVPAEYVKPLPLNTPTLLPNTGDVRVTLLEANHCPGSVLFLFSGRQTVNAGDSPIPSPFVGSKRAFRYLHCGDFRACPRHALHPEVRGKRLDLLYLDTTYLNPKYCFPPQPQVIDACAALARRVVLGAEKEKEKEESGAGERKQGVGVGVMQAMLGGWFKPKQEEVKCEEVVKSEEDAECEQASPEALVKPEPVDATFEGAIPAETGEGKPAGKGKTLVAIGTYSIGKERIVKAIAQALGSKIYCDARKRGLLMAQDDPELHSMLTSDPYTCQVHLLPLQNISVERMQDYLAHFKGLFDRVLGFRPTGWTYVPPAGTDTMPDVSRVIVRDQRRVFDETGLKPMRGASMQYMLYGVPYSEHSSFFELTCFALSVDVGKIIATVNVGSASSRGKMNKWFEKWEAERKRRRNAGETIVNYRTIDYW